MSKYLPDIWAGLGWEDICVKHNIVRPETKHRIRELVLSRGREQPRRFSIHEWRRCSGQNAPSRLIWRRPDRPEKRIAYSRPGPATVLARK